MPGDVAWLSAFRTPPARRDRPISWAVAVVSFVSIFFSMGLSFGSIGAMTLAFGDMFAGRASEDDVSWIGGIRLCFVFLTGIVSSMLVNRFGARLMQALGCAIAALAVGLSTLATELWHLYLAFGAIAGAGLSLVFTSSSVIVEGHFERYLHIALPLSQLGDTVGYSVFPVLTQALLNRIELRNTLLTFCGLTAVPLLLSVFYLPGVEKADDNQDGKTTPSAPSEVQHSNAEQTCSQIREKAAAVGAAKSLAMGNSPVRVVYRPATQRDQGAANSGYCADGDAAVSDGFVVNIERRTNNGPLLVPNAAEDANAVAAEKSQAIYGRGPIAGAGAAANDGDGFLNKAYVLHSDQRSSYDAVSMDNNRLTSNGLGIADRRTSLSDCTVRTTAAGSTAASACDPGSGGGSSSSGTSLSQWERLKRLLTRGEVWLLLVNMFGWQYSSASVFVLLPSYVTRSGQIDKDQAAIGLTLVGVANVVGNVVTVLAALRSYNRTLLYAISCLLFGVGVMLYSLTATNVAAYYALSTVNGFWLGIVLGLTMSVVFDFANAGSFTDMFGLVTFFSGLGGLAGPGITGIIQTRVSDAVGLYVSGAASLLACAVLVAPALRRHSSTSKEKSPIAA